MAKIDYSSWETMNLSVDRLRLDKENPRLPHNVQKASQDKLRAYLIDHEDVSQIAKLIVTDGYIQFEPIYAIKEGDFYVVLEGNRRTCALQTLRNPSLAPAGKVTYFKRLAKQIDPNVIEKIPVVVAPSKQDLRKIIYLKHAKSATKDWKPQQKTRFIAGAVLQGISIQELANELQELPSVIADAAFTISIQESFKYLGLDPEVEEVATSDKFPLSTMARIVFSAQFREKAGLSFDNMAIKSNLEHSQYKGVLKTIVEDLVNNKVNSRSLNKPEQITKYLDEVFSQMNPSTGEESYEFKPEITFADKDEEPKPPRKRKPKPRLIPLGLTFETGNAKLDMLIEQGQSIQAGQFLVAGAFILRTILELSVVRIFELHGKQEHALTKAGRTIGLHKLMEQLLKHEDWFDNKIHLSELKVYCDK